MILKIPTRKALIVLEQEIDRGFDLLHQSNQKVWEPDPPKEKESLDEELKRNQQTVRFKVFFFNEVFEWVNGLSPIFSTIFYSPVPHVRLLDIKQPRQNDILGLMQFIQRKLDVLGDYHRVIEEQTSNMLRYVHSRSVIQYYDIDAQIPDGSKQKSLCKYMFENCNFEQRVDRIDAFEEAFGHDPFEMEGKKPSQVVKNAAIEVNRTCKERFGFSIFGLPERQIYIKNPRKLHPSE